MSEAESEVQGQVLETMALQARLVELEEQLAASARDLEAVRSAQAEAARAALGHLRRALLAENAGQVVPELVDGSSVEELEASVERARAAFTSAVAAARAQLQQAVVPAGNPPRQGPRPEELSPLQKIVQGLKRG